MTLNITVVTADAIYQSADFRLTDPNTNSIVSDESNKTVEFSFLDWKGFVTYTGVGGWNGADISSYLGRWTSGMTQPTTLELVDVIRTEANCLFDDISQRCQRPRHSFVLAAFFRGKPQVFVISNFQDAYLRSNLYAASNFSVTFQELQPGHRPVVLLTGMRKAVSKAERSRLKRAASTYANDGGRMRRLLMTANRAAANSKAAKGLISEECIVRTLYESGRLLMETSGEGVHPTPQIVNGVDISEQLRQVFESMGMDFSEMKMLQSATSESIVSRPRPSEEVICSLQTVTDLHDVSHIIEEIASPSFLTSTATVITESGVVFGAGKLAQGSPDWFPWMLSEGTIQPMNFVGRVNAANDEICAVGIDYSEVPAQHGLRWINGEISRIDCLLSAPDGTECNYFQPFDINKNGIIAGYIARLISGKGTLASHPAVYIPNEGIITAPVPSGGIGSRAMAINASGLVLVDLLIPPFKHRLYLWNVKSGSCDGIGLHVEESIVPIGLAQDGTTLGQARDVQNRIIAVKTTRDNKWTELGTPPGYASSAISTSGDVVGTAKIDGLQRPWLLSREKKLAMLPHARDHHCQPVAVNSGGLIVGSASADTCNHAVIWRPKHS